MMRRSTVRGRACAALLVALAAAPGRGADAPSPSAGGEPVVITTTVEPKRVSIGTPFRYTMRIDAEKEIELLVPQLAGQIGDFQVVDFGASEPREQGGRIVLERWFTLLTYQAGDALVPGPSVQYRVPGSELRSIAAPDALVIVESLLAAPANKGAADVRDVKGPVAVPPDYTPLLWIGLGLAALAALIGGLFWAVNRQRSARLIAPRPAHEIALEALARLQAARLVEDGRHAEFYVRLSRIVRDYLEARFHLRAPEMTTEEFLQVAHRDPNLTPPQRALLGQFLAEADLVKFARHVPAPADAERAYAAARQFVQTTAPQEVPRAAA